MPRGPARKALAVAIALAFSHAAWGADVINAGGNTANLPTGGVPTNSANVTGSTVGASSLSVNISGRAVIDWSTFNIGSGNTVNFVGPGGAVLNRVPQGNAPGTSLANSSTIAGTLNGQNMLVMLMNPNGITFTSGSVVNVGALVATTGQIDEDEYVNHGNAAIRYPAGSPRAGIVNQGTITAEAAGLVALVAPSVANQGVISAAGGKILLAGTDTATISMSGGLYEFAVGGSGGSVTNASGATLSGATLYLSTGDVSNVLTSTINLNGIQQATGAIVVNGGTVALTSDLDAPVVSGNSNVVNVHGGGGRIQDGVDIAKAGGTVNVGAGTYHEQLKITKSLALLGAGASQTFVTPTSLTADADEMRHILTIGGGPATNAEVSGFTFAGPVAGITSGIFVRDGAHASIHGNHVTDIRETATISGNQTGIGIFVGRAKFGTSGTADIEDNVITGYQKGGIVVDGPGSSATISGNTIVGEGPTTAIAQNGVQVSRGASATVTGNAISGNAYTGPRADPDDFAAGILFFNSSPYVGQGGITVGSGNTITANEIGVWTNDPIMLTTTSLSGVSGNTRNAVAYFNGGYAGQGPLLEYPAWSAANAAFVNASAFSGAQSGDMVNTGGALRVYGWNGFAAIQPAINAVAAAGTVNVAAGTYSGPVTISKALTLDGTTGAKLLVADNTDGITIAANGVVVSDLELAGPVTSPYLTYAWGSNISRGVVVRNGVTGFAISNNNIHDVRNGILIDGRNTGSVVGNRIENTKSGISVQYTDGAGITISGNSEGPIGNEWGVNLHLNGFLDGGTIYANPHAAAPTLTSQQSLLALSNANGGWGVQDQGYSSSNRTRVTVAPGGSSTNQGSPLTPLDSIQGGINAVVQGGKVNIASGTYVQTATLNVNKSVTLAGAGEAQTTIDARGVTSYGISVSADNVTLKDFTVYGPSAFFPSAYGIKVSPGGSASSRLHNFTITNVTSRGAGKAELDLNGVAGATIDHVTADGTPYGATSGTTQGAGIQITDSSDVTISNSTTRNNAWGGVALYQANRSYDQRTTNITVQSNNVFNEANPLYLQDESASRDFGALALLGFDYAVRNSSTTNDNNQYTWMQQTAQGAFDLAVNLLSPGTSYIQGWTGSALTQVFHVGVGNRAAGGTQSMLIQTAIDRADPGATIDVHPGSYAESVVVNGQRNLTFDGATMLGLTVNASGTGLGGTATANGATGFVFNAPVVLTGNTSLTTTGAKIACNADIQNAACGPYALGLSAGTGDVVLTAGGSASDPIGMLTVSSNNFRLTGTLWVSGYDIDALGLVALSNHTLRQVGGGVANTIDSGDGVTGSTIAESSVQIKSGGDVVANVTTQSGANVSGANVSGSIAAEHIVVDAGQSVNVTVNTPNVVEVHADVSANVSGSAPSLVFDAPSGNVGGSFGQVSNVGGGVVAVNGKPQVPDTLSVTADNSRMVPAEGTIGANTAGGKGQPDFQSPLAGLLVGEAEGTVGVVRSSPTRAGELLDGGFGVEIDLAPGEERK